MREGGLMNSLVLTPYFSGGENSHHRDTGNNKKILKFQWLCI